MERQRPGGELRGGRDSCGPASPPLRLRRALRRPSAGLLRRRDDETTTEERIDVASGKVTETGEGNPRASYLRGRSGGRTQATRQRQPPDGDT